MDSSIRDYLPKQLALNEIVHTEEFTFRSFELPDGSFEYKQEYELSKSPVIQIRRVSATVDEEERELDKDEDYDVDNGTVVFNNQSNTVPDLDTKFTVTYKCESVLSRYISSVEERTEILSNKVGIDSEKGTIETTYKEDPDASSPEEFETITSSKYISTAQGDSLDEIGELFGDLGVRAGRDDERYREYLQSIATVYTGSGRKKNVAEAAATVVSSPDNNVGYETVEFTEYFDKQEFSIKLNEFESHRVSLLYDIIDLADPSGVRFVSPIYSVDSDDQEYIEGPKPDLDKYENIDSIDSFDGDFISPFNHESPDKGEYPSKIYLKDAEEIFDFGVGVTELDPINFEWAEKIDNEIEYQDNGNWNEFQWSSESWSGEEDRVEFTGVDWNAADWNKYPYTDKGVVGDELTILNDAGSSTIADGSIDESPQLTDITSETISDATIDGAVVTEPPSSVTLDIEFFPSDTTGSTDANTLEITDSRTDTSSINDDETLEIQDTRAEDTTSDITIAKDVNEVEWGTDWNTMSWDGTIETFKY